MKPTKKHQSTIAKELVDKYFDQIEIEYTDFDFPYGGFPDSAYLQLNVPTEMLLQYNRKRNKKRGLPRGAKFWKESDLVERLRNSDKYHGQGNNPLSDILDYLHGD